MKNARIEMRSGNLSKRCKMGSCFLRENIASVFGGRASRTGWKKASKIDGRVLFR